MVLDLCQNCVSPQYLEKINRFSPNFIYAFILTRSRLGLLHVIFRTFVPELWPFRVPISSGSHGKTGKLLKKVPCMEKSWNLKKPE